MKARTRISRYSPLAAAIAKRALIIGVSAMSFAAVNTKAQAEDAAPIRTGWADVQFYSIDPEKGLESYRRGSAGGAGLGGTFGGTVELSDATLHIAVSGVQRNGKFLVALKTEKSVGDEKTHPPELNREIDLTDLVPFSCELGRDSQGQIQRMTIIPKVRSQPLPKQFRLSELDLTDFNLAGLPVILNEREFIGTPGINGGEVISLQIAGLADIEFSLRPFPGATPDGVLRDGILLLRHDKDQLQISGVTNGEREEILSGGPHQVFVRWEPPQVSLEEYVASLEGTLVEFRKRAAGGDMHAKLLLPKFEEMTAVLTDAAKTKSRTASLYGSGSRQLGDE